MSSAIPYLVDPIGAMGRRELGLEFFDYTPGGALANTLENARPTIKQPIPPPPTVAPTRRPAAPVTMPGMPPPPPPAPIPVAAPAPTPARPFRDPRAGAGASADRTKGLIQPGKSGGLLS